MKIKELAILISVLLLVSFLMTTCQSPEVTSAKVYFQQDNIDAAEEQLLIALEKEPQNPEVPFLLATKVYAPRRDWDKVKDMLIKAGKLDPSYKEKVNKHTKRYWSEIHTEGANIFNNSIRAILPMEKDSLLSLATEKFKKALFIKSDEVPTYNGIVKCYFMLDDTLNVKKYTEMAKENGVFDQDVMYYYFQVMWQPEYQEEALVKLTNIISEHPEALQLQILQIQFLSEVERFEEALDVAKKTSTENPDNTDLRFVLAQIYVKTGDYESAQYEYQKVLAENPDDIDVLLRITEAFFQSKDWIMAEEYSRKLIELDPENVFGYDVLWKSLYNQGNKEEAEKYRQIGKSLR